MNTAPFEMVSGPLTVYSAPEDTPFPNVGEDPPSPWTLLGSNGSRSISDDGVSVSFEETTEDQRVLGTTGIVKKFRSEEDLMIGFTLLDISAETFAFAMSGLPIIDVPASGSIAADFTATPVPVVSGGAGSGARIASITVDSNGDITGVTWAPGSTGYATGNILTFTQGEVSGTYTLAGADHSSGVLNNLSGKTIAGTRPSTAGYRRVSLQRGFTVTNLAILARGYSPYGATQHAQWWIPKGYVGFSGSLEYVKGEPVGVEVEITAIESTSSAYSDYRYGLYMPED